MNLSHAINHFKFGCRHTQFGQQRNRTGKDRVIDMPCLFRYWALVVGYSFRKRLIFDPDAIDSESDRDKH
jgi:hypothetical protein